MEQQRLDYLERLIILNYLEVQHMKKALYAKLEQFYPYLKQFSSSEQRA